MGRRVGWVQKEKNGQENWQGCQGSPGKSSKTPKQCLKGIASLGMRQAVGRDSRADLTPAEALI